MRHRTLRRARTEKDDLDVYTSLLPLLAVVFDLRLDGIVPALRLAFSLQSAFFVSRRLVCDDGTGGWPCAVKLLEVDGMCVAVP